MNLVIDIGNTLAKCAVFDSNNLIHRDVIADLQSFNWSDLFARFSVKNVFVSSVRGNVEAIVEQLAGHVPNCFSFSHKSKLPFVNLYKTPETVGLDRLSAIAGAQFLNPQKNALVIDAGTAITFDFINSNGEYLGGNISPGLKTRFRALHEFTGKLPLVDASDEFLALGNTTQSAIISGVQRGIIAEIDDYIFDLSNKFEDLQVILTGGDAIFFEKKIKNTTFVNLNLVLIGLNRILNCNVL